MLAMLLDEPGGDLVAERLETACIGHVNLAEGATVLARGGRPEADVRTLIETVAVPVLAGGERLAIEAGLLWPRTRAAGSSLGDRFCLALALRIEATLLTSDERLAGIAPVVGVAVLPIRQPGGGSAR